MSFDLPAHGSRRGSSTRPPQDLYFNLANPKSSRGNILQGAADLIAVARLAEHKIAKPESPLDGPIAFNRERVALYGHSQGASHAALMIGSEPRIRAVVLAGLAGQITSQLLNLKRPVDTASILPFLLFDPDTKGKLVVGDANPVLALMQGYLDTADPVNFARQLHLEPSLSAADGHDAFLVYGLFDSFTPELTQKAYADAAALVAVDPDLTLAFNEQQAPLKGNVTPGKVARTVALRTYDPRADAINPDSAQDGHFVSTATRKGSADVRRFLSDALAGEIPQIGQ
jgi:pimeloyl-ACP methyl ester carboxylesterase